MQTQDDTKTCYRKSLNYLYVENFLNLLDKGEMCIRLIEGLSLFDLTQQNHMETCPLE